MSERKWTSGEWKSYEYEGVTHWPGIEAGSTSIVVWGKQWESEGVQGESLDEAKANAHLIAAAPDLYEALEACVDELMGILHGERDGVWSTEVFESVEAPYQKALSKARGETQ